MTSRGTSEWTHIERLVGVYEANGGLVGEFAYVVGKLLGRSHCSLCDITHSPLRRKAEWDAFVRSLPVPMEVVHLNERDNEVLDATDGHTPCVVACGSNSTPRILLDADALEAIAGSVDRFADALRCAVLEVSSEPGSAGAVLPGDLTDSA